MKAIVRLCFGLALSIALIAPASAELAMIGAAVTMRTGPSGKATAVHRIPQHAEIVLENCTRNWCRAAWRGSVGYIPADAIVLGPPPATLRGPPPAVFASPTYVTPPAWRWNGPYVGLNGGVDSGSR
jgi:Bacterial SH3 domain